jgi:two-component system response regulator FixJ
MRPRRLRVAVVDDEETVLRALARFFASCGYDVDTYASGLDFLEKVATIRPDCAVIDVHLSRLGALEVLDRLRKAGIDLPTVVVTGRHLPGVAQRALAAGASACLRKPLDGETLLNALTAAMHRANGARPFGEPKERR